MAIEVTPLSLPSSADPTKFSDFGRVVKGADLNQLTEEEFKKISDLLYKHDILVFHDVVLTPEQQYSLTKAFDPTSENYGHGNKQTEKQTKSLLHSILKTIPDVPQVQLIGNGTIHNHEGIPEAKLTHPSHKSFHKTKISDEDEAEGYTRFNRWHYDAALYELSPPKVTSLYALRVPIGPRQIVRYDDGSGDELEVPLAATAFISGKTMFDILPPELKSVAVRGRVKYAPHTFTWMATAKAMSTGIGMETEGKERSLYELPPWEEGKIKTYPFLWKNPVTQELHFQVHACGAIELFIDALPPGASRDDSLYPDGAHIADLHELRELLYRMQRPAIAPSLVYPHGWQERDLVLFNNRGVMHSVVGALNEEAIRVYHQCNLAASDEPRGPSEEDVERVCL